MGRWRGKYRPWMDDDRAGWIALVVWIVLAVLIYVVDAMIK